MQGGGDVRINVHNRCDDYDSYRAARVKSLFNAETTDLLREYANAVDEVLREHQIDGSVTDGQVCHDRVSFRAPLRGFVLLEQALARALGVRRCRLFLQVEVRGGDNS